MGQVWSKADLDGINEAGHEGGRGSVLAVTAQTPGNDRRWETNDDVLAPLNQLPASVSVDATSGRSCEDPRDRIRGFLSFHPNGAYFVMGDGSVQFVNESIDAAAYREFSTISR